MCLVRLKRLCRAPCGKSRVAERGEPSWDCCRARLGLSHFEARPAARKACVHLGRGRVEPPAFATLIPLASAAFAGPFTGLGLWLVIQWLTERLDGLGVALRCRRCWHEGLRGPQAFSLVSVHLDTHDAVGEEEESTQ